MHRRPLGLLALGLILAAAAAPAQDPAAAAPRPPRATGSPPSDSPPPSPVPGLQSPVSPPDSSPVVYPVGSEPQPEPSPVRWEGPIAHLGSVQVDSRSKTVAATGWVNQTEGPIEVLACGPKGKVHESVFVLALNPLDLQAALLLVGLKGGQPMAALGEGPPAGAPVDILVEWKDGGETRSARAETFVWNSAENAALPETPWTFTGSVVKDGQFKALAEDSLVVTYWDPYAIVNLPLPCGANDEILRVNTRAVPPYETPVTFRFLPR